MRELPGMDNILSSVHQAQFSEPVIVNHASIEPWAQWMELIESGNKQLDELKRSVGLGNALDAEAVIIAPPDEASQSLALLYGPEIEDALGAGCHRIEPGPQWHIRMTDVRDQYSSCARSWKRRPDVGSNPQYPDLSARDARVVEALLKQGSEASPKSVSSQG